MNYKVECNPVPLARPRFSRDRIYDAQRHHKNFYSIIIQQQHGAEPLFEKTLSLDVVFYFKKPLTQMNRQTLRGKTNKNYKEDGAPHIGRPDLDNLLKFILDVCNGIVFKDDSLVAVIHAEKVYGEIAKTEFTIKEI